MGSVGKIDIKKLFAEIRIFIGLLNHSLRVAHTRHRSTQAINERECSKKPALSPVEGSVQPCPEQGRRRGRSRFDARSVRFVREHGKTARTPLAAFFNIPFMAGWVLLLTSVGCGGSVIPPEQVVSVQQVKGMAQSYRLGPNDALRIEVFDEPDLLTETVVSGHGTIKFPLLGELRVSGMTVKEVEEKLTEKLEGGYLKSPKVTVSIMKYRNFYVSGEARNPGAFAYREGITVLKAITLAGGWTARAVKDEAKILRMVDGQQQVLTVTMEDTIQPDDILIVPESFF